MSNVKLSKLEPLNTTSGGILFPTYSDDISGATIDNLRLNVIDRGAPAADGALVELRTFDQVHYYNTTGNVLNLRTSVIQGAVYELTYTSSGGAANIDFVLNPNGTQYTSEFRDQYYFTTGDGTGFSRLDQTLNTIYFDHLGGGSGSNPMGTLRFTTGPTNKYYMYRGSDDGNLCFGYGRWTNNSRTWDWVGQLNFNGDNKRCWVRRIS
jgi:hypothetical protein